MKIISLCTILLAGLLSLGQAQELPTVSPKASVSQRVGITEISITYSRPSVNQRTIWGGVVSYGYNSPAADRTRTAPWRTGANENTIIETSHEIQIGENTLPAGKYGLFMAVFEDDSADVIFSTNYQGFGTLNFQPEHVLFKLKVYTLNSENFKEQLEFYFTDITAQSVTTNLHWGNKVIPFNMSVNTNEIVYENLLATQGSFQAVNGATTGGWNQAAAVFCMNNKIHLDQALLWSENAVNPNFGGLANFATLTTNANIRKLLGEEKSADSILNEAFNLEGISLGAFVFYGRQVINLELYDFAIKTYEISAKKFPDQVWVSKNGMANIYKRKGETKKAFKLLDEAIKIAPANRKERLISKKENWEKENR